MAELESWRAHGSDEGAPGATTEELARARGCDATLVRVMLRVLQREGRLEVGKGYRPGLDGRRAKVPVYSLRG